MKSLVGLHCRDLAKLSNGHSDNVNTPWVRILHCLLSVFSIVRYLGILIFFLVFLSPPVLVV